MLIICQISIEDYNAEFDSKETKDFHKTIHISFSFHYLQRTTFSSVNLKITRDNEFYLLCGEHQLRFDNFEKSGDNSKREIMHKII